MDNLNLQPFGTDAPSHWTPLLSVELMRTLALLAAERVAQQGARLTPIAATVTGSRLRGVDHENSDVDVLVLIAEKGTKAKTLAPWNCPVTGLETEGQVQSLDGFLSRVSTSVPYVEALTSPVMLADPAYGPLLRALRPAKVTLAGHAQRFAHHTATRAQCPVHKAANHTHAAYAVAHGLTPLLDREQARPGSARSLEVAQWVAGYALHRRHADLAREIDRPCDLSRALALAKYLVS